MKDLYICNSCGFISTVSNAFTTVVNTSGIKVKVCNQCKTDYDEALDLNVIKWVNAVKQ